MCFAGDGGGNGLLKNRFGVFVFEFEFELPFAFAAGDHKGDFLENK